MRGESSDRRGDEGFTLLEVLVAMAVISVAMAGLGAFFVNGAVIVAQQRDQRYAVRLAGNALEQVRALEPTALVDGRGAQKVLQQWQSLQNGPFKNKLQPYLDSMEPADNGIEDSTEGDNASLPTAPKTITVGGTSFTQNILVGTCEVYVTRTDKCVLPLPVGDPLRPADATSILEYYRVVVLETWQHKRCTVSGGVCGHIASTLISKDKADATYSTTRAIPKIRQPDMKVFYRGRNDVAVKMKVTGGNLPNTWSAVNLPDGLSIDPQTGMVGEKQTPTKVGTWSWSATGTYIKVVESQPPVGTLSPRSDTDKALSPALTWRVIEPPTARVPASTSYLGDPISIAPVVVDTTAPVVPYTYSIKDLPAELSFDPATGTITGTPAATFTATITATTTANYVPVPVTFTHTVYSPLTLQPIADQQVDLLSTVNLPAPVAAGGDGKYTFSASGLPAELSINTTTGVISGGPVLIQGRYLPTVTVRDGLGGSVSVSFALQAGSASSLQFTSPGVAVTSSLGKAVSIPVTTNAATIGVSISQIDAAGLPKGISLDGQGKNLTGTPIVPGVYTVTLTAISPNSKQNTQYTFVWTVL
ncbi:putative Ig domain-containing protein [Actinoplanes oblitus]|uniref:Ig domain-containing protein n=1 Tax=Actinoplanes oblitus TaxID=3040509 RepID=A0ABY8WDI0_9ACTN|nr:putative Ig domain-containing protein [Actinoplanes oblitus]WIM95176.1 putative Ig domain-containing protein [Actinoplanes oblitus]